MITIRNTSLISFIIEHAGTAAVAANAITATIPVITTSGLVATGRICRRNITADELTVFR